MLNFSWGEKCKWENENYGWHTEHKDKNIVVSMACAKSALQQEGTSCNAAAEQRYKK